METSSDPKSIPYAEVVARFAARGAEIIGMDRTARYEHVGALSTRPLEPGFIPLHRAPKIVCVSYYPNQTELDTTSFALARSSFLAWGRSGDVAAYARAYNDWLVALPSFPFHRDFDRPIFDELAIGDDEFAWLPLVKAPLPAKTDVSDADVFKDRMLLWEQLWLLRPAVILAQGMKAADVVRPMCEEKFPHAIVVQKIGRYGSTASHRAEDARVVADLRRALERNADT